MLSHIFFSFSSLRRDDREVEDGFSEIRETSVLLERGILSLCMNRKAFKTLFKKSFNLLSPASIFLSYVRNGSFQEQLSNSLSGLFSTSRPTYALPVSSSIHGKLTCYQKAHPLVLPHPPADIHLHLHGCHAGL